MRNNYEHFDEGLDKWWKESKTRSVIDLNIGPRSFLSISIDSLDWFRNFEATTLKLTFWSEDFNIQELIAEVQRIFPRVEEEANKPH